MTTEYADMTQPLPGWFRFRNLQTGVMIDFNPRDPVHQGLLVFYRKSTAWKQIAP